MKRTENIEEYLEALWTLEEKGKRMSKISTIAQVLNIASPSVVEMFKKLEKQGYVTYKSREGVELTTSGREIARQIVRNHRLAELLVEKTLKGKLDEDIACGIEHHISEEFADALCISLNHPKKCPHGKEIPRGKCCKEAGSTEQAQK